MQRKQIFALLAIFTGLACGTVRAVPVDAPPSTGGYIERSVRLTQLLEKPVVTETGTNVGRFGDVVFDLANGRIYAAGVRPSNTFGQFQAAIPEALLLRCSPSGVLIRDLGTNNDLTEAPTLPLELQPGKIALALSNACVRFGTRQELAPGAATNSLIRADVVLGQAVKNPMGLDLGTMTDVLLDAVGRQVFFAVISLDGGNTNLYAVPVQALSIGMGGTNLVLDAAQAKVAGVAHDGGFLYAQAVTPQGAAEIYRFYGMQPDFAQQPPPPVEQTSENLFPKITGSATTVRIVRIPADSEIYRRIMEEAAGTDLSTELQDGRCTVNAQNGRVTLTGKVKSQAQKEAFGTLAAKVVGADNVVNELETGP